MNTITVLQPDDPVIAEFHMIGTATSVLGPLKFPLASLAPKIGSLITEWRSEGSVPYRIVARRTEHDAGRLVYTVELAENTRHETTRRAGRAALTI